MFFGIPLQLQSSNSCHCMPLHAIACHCHHCRLITCGVKGLTRVPPQLSPASRCHCTRKVHPNERPASCSAEPLSNPEGKKSEKHSTDVTRSVEYAHLELHRHAMEEDPFALACRKLEDEEGEKDQSEQVVSSMIST